MNKSAQTMHRRHLLAALASAGLTSTLPSLAQAKPAQASSFAAALVNQPLLTPFKGVTDSSGDCHAGPLVTRGKWPAALQGRFYRNGPALYERAGQRYQHWFDGDGMVQQFTLAGGRVRHIGRLVRTSKLAAEQQAGRFLMSAFGTHIEDGANGSGPDSFNPANTNALEHAGRVLAMWEGGSAYALNPSDLSTQGPVVWRKDLQEVPFSAHPKVDATGHLWNVGTAGDKIIVWHIDPLGALVKVQIGPSPYPGGMAHDMAVTERYIVLPLPAVKLQFGTPSNGPRQFALQAGQPLRVLVMDKADISRRRVFELPSQMVFHVGNAFETRNSEIVLSYIGAPDVWFLNEGAVAVMQGRPGKSGKVQTHIARLNMATGQASLQAFEGETEFPRIDPRRIGLPARWLLTGAAWKATPGRQNALFHGLQLQDMHSGRRRRYDYGAHVVAEEHILLPQARQNRRAGCLVVGHHLRLEAAGHRIEPAGRRAH